MLNIPFFNLFLIVRDGEEKYNRLPFSIYVKWVMINIFDLVAIE